MAVSTLNSTIRLIDRERGEMLQKFIGHRSESYRSHISMSYDEARILAGDEDGLLWAWDLESVGQMIDQFRDSRLISIKRTLGSLNRADATRLIALKRIRKSSHGSRLI